MVVRVFFDEKKADTPNVIANQSDSEETVDLTA